NAGELAGNLRQELCTLSLPDKKLLIEAFLKQPIDVYAESDSSGKLGKLELEINSSRINIDVIKRFMEEGKLSRLKHNSTDYSGSHENSAGNHPRATFQTFDFKDYFLTRTG
ncbi:MAG: hypothetical protein U9R49_13450, partial [Bacteroidota bacterium]|nr:hypothetical protein [Bacteroidota bacterium]